MADMRSPPVRADARTPIMSVYAGAVYTGRQAPRAVDPCEGSSRPPQHQLTREATAIERVLQQRYRQSDRPATGAAAGTAALTANEEFSLRHLVRQIVREEIVKENAKSTLQSQAPPQQESTGFEPRGTVLAQRLAAWKNLQDASTWDGMLSMYPEPQDVTKKPRIATTAPPVVGASSPTPPSVLPSGNDGEQETPSNGSQPEVPPADEEEGSYGRLGQSPPASKGRKRKQDPQDARSEPVRLRRKFGPMWKRRGEGAPRNRQQPRYFCSEPSRNYGHLVFGPAVLGANLFTLEALLSICRTDLGVLRRPDSLRLICERVSPHRCCTSWSIPHFITLLHNRSSCMDITATDVQKVCRS
ncbi:hypothetical protein HPB51_027748 [Rhipicephalus microplus]|uniref:Uncharacterized protein n=1 Tax=Rhipicephalus microplus TaxID=6941 RepID=A0A9J6CZ89_RHIMP|nr:hypothetical protein HPB51_027748 [Rhipicephalus microplus]